MLHDAALSYLALKRIRIDNSTTTANASANETNNAQADSSPPALGSSFESTDSSETSSVDCLSLRRAAHAPFVENEKGEQPQGGSRGPVIAMQHGHEYYSALHAARERLRLAKTIEANSREQLQRALEDHERSKQEVQSSSAFLDQVEERWGVIDLVHTGSADESDGVDRGEVDPPVTSIFTSSAHQDQASDVELIQVSQAGEGIVNGTYRLVRDVEKGPVYVHSEGPVEILDAHYDLCIYMKTGYGDRIRWCVALVPFTSLAKSDKGRMEVGKDDERRELELAQAYIYYWIELYAAELNCTSPPTGSDSEKWGACHGERPMPVLKDVTGRRRWWHFWR